MNLTTHKQVRHVDLIVIGAGSGGLATAKKAASFGAKVVIIEKETIGGTCVNVGCVPKKIMWNAGGIAEAYHYSSAYGFSASDKHLNFAQLVKNRQHYIKTLNDIYFEQLAQNEIEYISGIARFIDHSTIQVGDEFFHGQHIIIATGCSPKPLLVKGAELAIDSNGFFALTTLPKKVAIIGAGYIAVELASILHMLGAAVTLVLRHDKPLRQFDAIISDSILDIMRSQGVSILTKHDLQEITRQDDDSLSISCHQQPTADGFNIVLFSIGRIPATHDLNLAAAGVETNNEGFIITDKWETTNIKHIYAIGDITGKKLLTPVAIAAGRQLATRLFGPDKDAHLDYKNIPSVIFTHPPMGSVGLSEQEAIDKYGKDELTIYQTKFNSLFYALSNDKIASRMKLITVKPEEKIVGCHLVGLGVDEMLQGFSVAIKMGATKKDFDHTVAIHPTNAEELVTLK